MRPNAEHFGGYVPPNTDTERRLVEIWEEILCQCPIGLDDDFFSCGGDSIRAIRVMFRIAEKLNADIDVTEMFSHPTVRGLAELVGRQRSVARQRRIERRPRPPATSADPS